MVLNYQRLSEGFIDVRLQTSAPAIERTWAVASHMSASDPKRTCHSRQESLRCRVSSTQSRTQISRFKRKSALACREQKFRCLRFGHREIQNAEVAHGHHYASHRYFGPVFAVWWRLVRPRTLVLNMADLKLGGAATQPHPISSAHSQSIAEKCGLVDLTIIRLGRSSTFH